MSPASRGEVHRVQLAPRPQSIQRARRFVRRHIDSYVDDDQADVAELLTSELVTNAIVHTGTALELLLEVGDGRVRVEVRDQSDKPPRLNTDFDPLAVGGRGLQFVDQLATFWGVEDAPSGPGKRVWFQLE